MRDDRHCILWDAAKSVLNSVKDGQKRSLNAAMLGYDLRGSLRAPSFISGHACTLR
jgi:hypothetical protein